LYYPGFLLLPQAGSLIYVAAQSALQGDATTIIRARILKESVSARGAVADLQHQQIFFSTLSKLQLFLIYCSLEIIFSRNFQFAIKLSFSRAKH
jgi:hypothetical protein